MIKYIPYVLMFAIAGALVYIWGLKKAQNQTVELARSLYKKCEKIVCKELKKKEYLQKKEIEKLVEHVQVGQFYSKNRIGVTNPKEFVNAFVAYMIKNDILEEEMINGKKVYKRKNS